MSKRKGLDPNKYRPYLHSRTDLQILQQELFHNLGTLERGRISLCHLYRKIGYTKIAQVVEMDCLFIKRQLQEQYEKEKDRILHYRTLSPLEKKQVDEDERIPF